MVGEKSANPDALVILRKYYAARVKEYEGKIKHLGREIDEEKKKPAFKTSTDERHGKYQEAARRSMMRLQSRLTYYNNMRAMFLAELNACIAEQKGHVLP
jgi:hypothetical protein